MSDAAAPLLRIIEMTKRFPGTLALDGVAMVVERATIHGLVGENGAGKSTLLKILAGDYRPTSGRIELEGEEVDVATPRRAHELGIGIVYQELSLLTNLSVAHNISLGSEPMSRLAVDERRLAKTAARVLARMGVGSIDPAQKVGKLPLAERQLVEIAKVLTLRQPRVLISRRADRGARTDRRRATVQDHAGPSRRGRRDHLRQSPLPRGAAESATARPVLRTAKSSRGGVLGRRSSISSS
jgi:ribose transport system ATP-binding protein